MVKHSGSIQCNNEYHDKNSNQLNHEDEHRDELYETAIFDVKGTKIIQLRECS